MRRKINNSLGKKIASVLMACLYLVVFPVVSETGIFKWKDQQGRTHFSDRAPVNEKVTEVKLKINSYTNTSVISTPLNFAKDKNINKEVIMYSTAWCPSCRKAKAYFKERGIEYTEYDVETTEKGRADFKELGGSGVPIILVGDKRLNGFSKSAFDAIYGS